MIALNSKLTNDLEEYMRSLKNLRILSREEEHELFKRVQAKDRVAKNTLITHNMRFALKVALQYSTKHLTIPDLLSEASIGLSRAVDEFNPATGLKFISYAVWWIKSYINRAVCDKDNTIRVPANATSDYKKAIKKLKSTKKEDTYDLPSALQKVADVNNMGQLDALIFETERGGTLKDTLVYEEEKFESLETFEMKNAVDDVLSVFTGKESKYKEVFIRVFGLKSGTPETLNDIAVDMGLTRERVRQIKQEAYGIISKRYIKDKLGKESDLEKELKYTR